MCGCALSPLSLETSPNVGKAEQGVAIRAVPSRGFLVHVQCQQPLGMTMLAGELLWVGKRSVWLWSEGAVAEIHRGCVVKAFLERHESRAASAAAWGTLGLVSTFFHGTWSGLTAPVWLITTTAASAGRAAGNDVLVLPHQLDRLAPYSRFPTGPPTRYTVTAPHPAKGPVRYYSLEGR